MLLWSSIALLLAYEVWKTSTNAINCAARAFHRAYTATIQMSVANIFWFGLIVYNFSSVFVRVLDEDAKTVEIYIHLLLCIEDFIFLAYAMWDKSSRTKGTLHLNTNTWRTFEPIVCLKVKSTMSLFFSHRHLLTFSLSLSLFFKHTHTLTRSKRAQRLRITRPRASARTDEKLFPFTFNSFSCFLRFFSSRLHYSLLLRSSFSAAL